MLPFEEKLSWSRQDFTTRWHRPHIVCGVTQTWQVEPSGPLRGDITVRGSKNAVTKHMVAAMLGHGPSVIRNAPEVGDVDITAAMLESVGFHVGRDGGEITITPGDEVRPKVPEAFTGLNRIPILMLGPLLHRAGEAFVPLVGGDPIGRRPVDFHLEALTALGAEIEHGPTGITAKATRLHGARITLPYPSVGATETVLLSAVLADGKTVLRNAATEPEVVELALFLQRMGAKIELSPDRRIVIEGVEQAEGRVHQARRRPPRGVLLPGRGADHPGRGAGARLPAGPPGHRDHHARADGRPVRHHRRVDHRVGPGRAAVRRPCTPTPTRAS